MLESLRDAFRQAFENFKSELDRDRIPEAADRLLRAMQTELVAVKRQSEELAAELKETRKEAEREKAAAETCVRREELALEIGDEQTAAVAREFAEKHLRRHEILLRKTEVIAQELEDRESSYSEMVVQFKEARAHRESLSATAGRTDSRESIRGAEALFEEMDRMAGRIRDLEGRAEAAQEIDDAFGELRATQDELAEEAGLDERLEELKRKMGRG